MNKKILIGMIITLTITLFLATDAIARTSNKQEENYANIVIFAHFSGSESEADKKYFEDNRDELINIYNGSYERSVTSYLNTISYNKFHIKNIFPQDTGTVINSLELPLNKEDAYSKNIDSAILEIVLKQIPDIEDSIVDYNNDGFIDNLTIILKGGDKYNEIKSGSTFVNHKSDYPINSKWSGKIVGTYNILNTYSVQESITANEAGVIVHEFLHSLGYPDLYRINGSDHPVYIWDIMASANRYMQYPLAYLRMHFSNWIDIETVTTSGHLRLDVQSNPDGNQAYILKSPLNEYEVFVVEFRKKGNSYNSLDGFIGGSGIIVYRINKTATGLSNAYGDTGVYIFRPNGSEDTEITRVLEAYLSEESGRTTIGSSDMNLGLEDGALTFSDGTNSGIVIKNVSSSNNNYMTLDVEIPSEDEYDLWKDTKLEDLTDRNTGVKYIQIEEYNNKPYFVSYCNNKIYTQSYENNEWKTKGTYYQALNPCTGIMELKKINNELYLIYSTANEVDILKWSEENSRWNFVTSIDGSVSDMNANVINGKLYIVVVTGMMSDKANLYILNDNKANYLGTYCNEMGGSPKIVSINDKIYVAIRLGDDKIKLYLYDNNSFLEIQNSMNSNTYDLKVLNNNMYFVLGKSENANLIVYKFDGNNFSEIKSEIRVGFPQLTVSQGNLYILAHNENNQLVVYSFDEENKEFSLEGATVDTATNSACLVSIDNNIYVGLNRTIDGSIAVKEKQTTNSLLSLTIIPPKKYTYKVNEKIDTTGLEVIANYKKGQKVVTNYSISGFNSSIPGTYNVTITYEGVSNIYPYEVIFTETTQEKELVKIDNTWRMVINGEVDYIYTGVGTNDWGTWYFENGEINFKFTDTYYEGDKAYIVENGKVYEIVARDMTGMVKVDNTIWRMIENGKVNYIYNGLGTNNWGTWYFENGEINFKFTGTYKDNNGDTWIIKEGKVESVTGLRKIDNTWRMVINGKVDYTYAGVGTNDWGTWYFENGEINFKFTDTYYEGDKAYIVENGKVYEIVARDMTGMVKVDNTIWRMIENGKINYTYKGIGTNNWGIWYFENGEINFDYTGTYCDGDITYVIEAGKMTTEISENTTGMVKIDKIWRMIENGKINYTYKGLGTNNWGTWYFEDGEINFNYTGKFIHKDGNIYNIFEGKVINKE